MKKYKSTPCSAPWDGAFVYGNGDVYPCCKMFDEDNMLLGNLNDNTFEEILDSDVAWKLRKAWVSGEGLEKYPCESCYVGWSKYCQTYFREDVENEYFKKAFKEVDGKLEKIAEKPFEVKRVEFQISQDCMLDCNFCHREQVPAGKEAIKSVKFIDTKLVENVIEDVKKIGTDGCTVFTHGNAEPLTHPDKDSIYKILCSQDKIYSNITTNAVALTKKFVDTIVRHELPPTVHVSLYGPDRETYRKVTGRDTFNKVIENIEYLLEQRAKYDKKNLMSVTFAIVITPENEPNLSSFLDLCTSLFKKHNQKVSVCFNDVGITGKSKISVLADMEQSLHPSVVKGFWKVEEIKNKNEFNLLSLKKRFNKKILWLVHPNLIELENVIKERIKNCIYYSRDEIEKQKYIELEEEYLKNKEIFNEKIA